MRSHAKAVVIGLTLLASLVLGVALAVATAPTVTIDTPSAVDANQAHLSGHVRAEDADVFTCRFEFVTDDQFTTDGFAQAEPNGQLADCDVFPTSGTESDVQADLGGLTPNTLYHVRLFADNGEQSFSTEETFRTDAVTAPVVTIDTPSSAFTTARLSGSVDPEGTDDAFNASCRFDYVTDDQFGIDGFDSANQTPCDTDPVTGSDPVTVRADLSGLNHSTLYHARLVASNLGGQSPSSEETFTTGTVIAPTATISTPSSVTGTTAHFSGTVNPNAPGAAPQDPAFDSSWSFSCTPNCFGLKGGTVASDDTDNPVADDATHLRPNTDYTLTLRATNLGGEDTDQIAFRTDPVAPGVQITGASFPSSTQTQLNGYINPNNSQTSYWFEWGTRDCSANPCTAVPASRDADAGSGPSRFVSQQVSGLDPGATYHYRLLADNGTGGLIASEDVTFTAFLPDPSCTNPGAPGAGFLPNCRAWEMVSPPSKNGGEVSPDPARTRAASDGSATSFSSLAAFADARGTGVATEYISQRSTSPAPGNNGWSTHAITPAQESQNFAAGILGSEPHYPGAFSDDLSHAVFRSWSPLTDAPEVAEVLNLYVRDDVRTPGAGNYVLASPCPVCVTPMGPEFRGPPPTLAGASVDFEHLIFESLLPLAPGASGFGPKLYQWDRGVLSLAGVLPDGSPAERSIAGRGVNSQLSFLRTTSRPMSQDGSRVVFTVPPSDNAASGAIYMRIAARTSIKLNASERTVPDSEQDATYWDASADHSRVFFTSPEALTDDAPATGEDQLYMWSRQAANESQSVTVGATGGTFTLTLGGLTTNPIAFDASAATLLAELEALTTVGAGNVNVSGGPGNETGSAPYEVTFEGDLAGVNMPELQSDPSSLTGGGSSAAIATTTPLRNLTYLNVDVEPSDASNAVPGVLGTSEDGRYVYFVAVGQLVMGKPTLGVDHGLYLWHDGTISYVGKLTGFPVDRDELLDGLVTALGYKQTDVTPDGRHLVFSTGAGDGLLSAHGGVDYNHGDCGRRLLTECREVYVYSADDDELACASCNPSGAPATANAIVRDRQRVGGTVATTYLSRVISDDGRYAFFTTREALITGDTNNREDAYVYDLRVGRPRLLSSGTHPSDSYFLEASPSGRDAFFVTRERLAGWDVDQAYDLYDARVDGGFPEPVPAPAPCVGDGCQGSPGANPNDLSSASSSFHGAGTQQVRRPRKVRCGRNARKVRRGGKVRCVKKKTSKRAANTNRRASR